jgi:protein O-GlcNAc transferase
VTTLEGILMGVPLITLRGQNFAGRTGASILTTLGLADWIAETPERYVAVAMQKAQDISFLAKLRQQMRDRLMTSVLGDTNAYARIVEREYRQLWREWCQRATA